MTKTTLNAKESGALNEPKATRYQCDLSVLDHEQRTRRAQLAAEIWSRSRERKELATGYEFRFDFSPTLVSKIAELATLEHLCCPFLDLGIMLSTASSGSQLLLRLTGDSGAKEFLEAELGLQKIMT